MVCQGKGATQAVFPFFLKCLFQKLKPGYFKGFVFRKKCMPDSNNVSYHPVNKLLSVLFCGLLQRVRVEMLRFGNQPLMMSLRADRFILIDR